MALGEKIRGARKSTGMTQEQLAGILGVSRQAVTKWESGKGLPDIENLRIMAKALNVSIDYLLEDETDLDFSVTREAINLDDYEDKGRWKKKARIVREKFPEGTCHPLMSEKERTPGQKILDFFLQWGTDIPESMDLVNAFDNLDKQFYLVESGDDQYLVEITDEFMEIRRLSGRIAKSAGNGSSFGKFSVGEWTFRDCGILND